ncbi:hypothetical protein ABZ719_00140 [Streptomyces sp. NPDC006743]|uniref:hypothetical protein n=1 Tax=Streptomyces sp. NPDC006743 TaxID=3154480 RepID=UPI0034511AFF
MHSEPAEPVIESRPADGRGSRPADGRGSRPADGRGSRTFDGRGSRRRRRASDDHGPVFVDTSGRRSKALRRLGLLVGFACLAYTVVLGAAFMGWGTSLNPSSLLPFGGDRGGTSLPGGHRPQDGPGHPTVPPGGAPASRPGGAPTAPPTAPPGGTSASPSAASPASPSSAPVPSSTAPSTAAAVAD